MTGTLSYGWPEPLATWPTLEARQSVCRACPRLVAWREEVAVTRRAAYADQAYWGRPAPGWGDHEPRVLVVGLAPAAHGANRTGRVFTGDRSGDWLFAALHRAGFANQPSSTDAGDGLVLTGARVVAAVRCAPPANKPTPLERDTCAPWLDRELALVRPSVRVLVALGAFAWDAALAAVTRAGDAVPSPRPRFGHGAEVHLPTGLVVLGTLPPQPAEHLHRPAHRTDARRGLLPRGDPRPVVARVGHVRRGQGAADGCAVSARRMFRVGRTVEEWPPPHVDTRRASS